MQDRALRPGPQSSPHSRAEAPRARKALSRNHAPSRGPSPPEAKASAVLERNEVRLPYPLRGLRSSGPTMGDTALDYRIVADAFQRLPDLPYEVNNVTAKMELLLPKLDEVRWRARISLCCGEPIASSICSYSMTGRCRRRVVLSPATSAPRHIPQHKCTSYRTQQQASSHGEPR